MSFHRRSDGVGVESTRARVLRCLPLMALQCSTMIVPFEVPSNTSALAGRDFDGMTLADASEEELGHGKLDEQAGTVVEGGDPVVNVDAVADIDFGQAGESVEGSDDPPVAQRHLGLVHRVGMVGVGGVEDWPVMAHTRRTMTRDVQKLGVAS